MQSVLPSADCHYSLIFRKAFSSSLVLHRHFLRCVFRYGSASAACQVLRQKRDHLHHILHSNILWHIQEQLHYLWHIRKLQDSHPRPLQHLHQIPDSVRSEVFHGRTVHLPFFSHQPWTDFFFVLFPESFSIHP